MRNKKKLTNKTNKQTKHVANKRRENDQMNEEQNLYEQRKCILHCILLVSKLLHHTLKVDQMNEKQNLLQKIALGLRKGPIG